MSAFLNYEGTADYMAVSPALIVTFAASGSITAGRAVCFNTAGPGYVYQPSGVPSGSLIVAGVALQTVSDADPVPVMVWGYAKSLPALPTTGVFANGQALVVTGSGYWTCSGSVPLINNSYNAGKIISGSAGYMYAFIDCMRNVV